MTTFTSADDLAGAEFLGVDLRGARFRAVTLTGVVMRAMEVDDVEIDAPWLVESGASLVVNGVDVTPLVDAELDRRFPGRELRGASDPAGLREAWRAVERTWEATCARVAAMPAGTVDVSVAGEWSFAETLRHLVMATDTWLRKAILQEPQPYHPIGRPDSSFGGGDEDPSVFSTTDPTYEEVLAVRAERVAMVRDFLATVTPELLAEERRNPHDDRYPETVLSCLRTILEEEWEHHRYAVRDLDAIEAGAA